jgi:hypothetical protein
LNRLDPERDVQRWARVARLAGAVLAIDRTSDVSTLIRIAAPLMPARLASD